MRKKESSFFIISPEFEDALCLFGPDLRNFLTLTHFFIQVYALLKIMAFKQRVNPCQCFTYVDLKTQIS